MKSNRSRLLLAIFAIIIVVPALVYAIPKPIPKPPPPSVTATATAINPNPVASGQTATSTLNASAVAPTSVPGGVTYGAATWTWSATGAPGLHIAQPHHNSPAATLRATIAAPGNYTLIVTATATWRASNGTTVSASGPVAISLGVVGVQKLQYFQPGPSAGFMDVPATLYVLVGNSVTFQAIATPESSSFPTGNAVWSGSSGASGTGSTKTVMFSHRSTSSGDYKTVKATCGNTHVTVNVVVYDFQGVLTPEVDFRGRSYTRFGICETIILSYTIAPSSVTESDIGGLQWEIESGGGELTGGSGGTGNYACSDEPGQVVLRLFLSGGPCLGQDKQKVIDKDAPTLVRFEKATASKKSHVKGTASAGFLADMYFEDKNVSFVNIVWKEGKCKPSTTTGAYNTDLWKNMNHSEGASWTQPFAAGAQKGTHAGGRDAVWSGGVVKADWKDDSKFTWDIPWTYFKKGDQWKGANDPKPAAEGKSLFTVRQEWVSDAAGNCTISKPTLNDAAKKVQETRKEDDLMSRSPDSPRKCFEL